MIRIITDSTSDIDVEYAQELNVGVVPLKVIINGTEYKDRMNLQPDEFYQLLQESEVLPTTSQPSPQDFLDAYQEGIKNNDSIIVITLSSGISGTYQSANIAKDLAEYDDIHVIDSLSTTQGLRLLVEKAVRLRNEGLSVNEIVDYLEEYKTRIEVIAIVDTLEYLVKGGRLSRVSGAVGTLLKFKPIIAIKDGKLESLDKCRGIQKATERIVEYIQDAPIDLDEPLSIGFTGSHKGLDKFENILKENFHFENPLYGFVGPVIGTHAGPGAKAIFYVRKKI